MENSAPENENITPETKVGKLLEDHPELEDVLIRLSPSFKKLRNPVLRKTVAKVATLRQVARVGGISLADLINTLRREAGLSKVNVADDDLAGPGKCPAWFNADRIVKRFDARPMIEAGQQPMGTVLTQIRELAPGEVYELTTPFIPAPLIDMAKGKGFAVWTRAENPEIVKTYIHRPQ